uniref:Fungal lipase-type domain-containing protein n=1 Tax=Araucaria cunninghamii TaxID=56994 RepID=A0A0D6QS50_ARACU
MLSLKSSPFSTLSHINSPSPTCAHNINGGCYFKSMGMRFKSGIPNNDDHNILRLLPPLPRRSKSNREMKASATATTTQLQSMTTMLTTLEEEQSLKGYDYPADAHGHGQQHNDNIADTKKRTSLSEVWREVQGSSNWEGMLDPMNNLLRSELIKYGEFAQACYDAFDFDPYSSNCGGCKYNRRTMFKDLGLSHSGYHVTKHLYATSNIHLPNFFKKSRIGDKLWSNHANWMGFVAVAEDEQEIKRLGRRDIVIAWRGTVTSLEWMADLMDFLKPAGFHCDHPDPRVKVESGFLDLYTAREKKCRFAKSSAQEQIHAEIKRLVEKYKGEELSITVTGHSLGSALAMLSAYDIAEMGVHNGVPITVFSFAGPRVGNSAFKDRLEELGVKILRIVNTHDGVPKVPGILFNEHCHFVREWIDKLPWSYTHVGVELELDHTKSPFLRPTSDPSCFHNLEAHLHLLDGYHGREQRFYLANGRDPALVNKACDFLQDHLHIPPFWRQDHNKGMAQNAEGRWVRPQRPQYVD